MKKASKKVYKKGLQKGLREGIKEGLEKGRERMAHTLLCLIERKFGELNKSDRSRVLTAKMTDLAK